MRHATLLLSVLAGAAQSAACGHGDMEMMTDHAAALETHLVASESEMTDHHALVDAALTLGDAQAAEDAHENRMTDHTASMMHEMGEMAGCMEEGSADMSAMFDDAGLLGDEREAHAFRMAAATSRAEARAEEARHHDRMSDLMGKVRDHMKSVMSDMDDAQCPCHE